MKNEYMNISYSNSDIILTPNEGYDNVIIWLHGLGDSAYGFLEMFMSSSRPVPNRTKCILLTAAKAPVTLNGGFEMNSWYDIYSLDKDDEDAVNQSDVEKSTQKVIAVIEEEAKLVKSYKNIVLGGFSQGACITLNIALTYKNLLNCYIVLSGLLFPFTVIENKTINLFICHGVYDEVIPEALAMFSYDRLSTNGLSYTYNNFPIGHTIDTKEISQMKLFVEENLYSES